jgi:methionyl-tRNA formyltransferase
MFVMTRKGLDVLESVCETWPEIVEEVVCARDTQIKDDHYVDIRVLCDTYGIRFRDRGTFERPATEYVLAISWRWLIDPGSAHLIVLHDSLLPAYRGFNPLVTALINGDQEIGVTALYATSEYDRGEIITQASTRIDYPVRLADAIDALGQAYRAVTAELTEWLRQDLHPPSRPQDEAMASYSLWRDEEDYHIDWAWTAPDIRRFIDAVGYPYKGAKTYIGGRPFRVLSAQELEDVRIANRTPGKVLFLDAHKPIVVCGQGLLRIDDMVDETGTAALPLHRFRTRFS